jgi:hypothetical protein
MPKLWYARKILNIAVWIFYTATVFLWFKNSFSHLKSIPISYLIPFAGLCFTVFLKLLNSIREKNLAFESDSARALFGSS